MNLKFKMKGFTGEISNELLVLKNVRLIKKDVGKDEALWFLLKQLQKRCKKKDWDKINFSLDVWIGGTMMIRAKDIFTSDLLRKTIKVMK